MPREWEWSHVLVFLVAKQGINCAPMNTSTQRYVKWLAKYWYFCNIYMYALLLLFGHSPKKNLDKWFHQDHYEFWCPSGSRVVLRANNRILHLAKLAWHRKSSRLACNLTTYILKGSGVHQFWMVCVGTILDFTWSYPISRMYRGLGGKHQPFPSYNIMKALKRNERLSLLLYSSKTWHEVRE